MSTKRWFERVKRSRGRHWGVVGGRWPPVGVVYLHHHLLPCQWLTDGGVGWQIGPLELQGDVVALLL